jgi:Fuc2NAc and GlcNAc transferase
MISLALSGFMISAGLLDKPVERSNHKEDVPTAGGVGIAAGTGAGLLALAMFYPGLSNQSLLGAISAILLGVGFVGLVDDIYDTPASIRFVVIIALAAAAVVTIGPPTSVPISVLDITLPYWAAFAGSILWVFVLANGVNFMDGANGLMGGFMSVSFVFLATIALMFGAVNAAVLSTLIAAAIIGFLPYNWKTRAHIFSGDVGALFVGFGYAICVLLLVRETGSDGLLFVGPLLVLPFLTDILITMLARARRRENLMSPHSSHIYQRLIREGYSHTIVTLMYVGGALIAGFTTLYAIWVGLHRSFFYLGLAICVWVFIYLVLHQKLPNGRDPQQK